MSSEDGDSQQFRFFSSGSPGTPVYVPPEPGNPSQFLIGNIVTVHPCGDVNPLIAGQDFDNPAGKVFIWNNDENLYVKFQVYSPWYMTETAEHSEDDPPPPNNPEDLHSISLSSLGVGPGDWVYIMAHAVVDNLDTGVVGETAWKEGIDVPGQSGAGWAMYNEYKIQKIPWLEVSISETEIIWDAFKPGDYMSLGSVLWIASNSDVTILYGTGGPDRAPGPAVREGSLLPKTPGNPGTPPDEITFWVTCVWGEPSSPHIGDPELLPPEDQWSSNPEDLFRSWIRFDDLNTYQMKILKSAELENGIAFSHYHIINVDPCCSEGNYFDQFAITITIEP